jgi:hypothetical protein
MFPVASFLQLQAIVGYGLLPFTLAGALGTFVLLGVTSGLGAFRLARHCEASIPVARVWFAIVAAPTVATLGLYAAGLISKVLALSVLIIGVLIQAMVKEAGLRSREYDLAQLGLRV